MSVSLGLLLGVQALLIMQMAGGLGERHAAQPALRFQSEAGLRAR